MENYWSSTKCHYKDSLEKAEQLGISVKFSEFGSYPEIKSASRSQRVDCFSVDGAILFGLC